MSPWEMIQSIIGEGTVQPYTIVLLVISISLVCISLDLTGAINYISWRLISYFVTTKLRLFTLIYFLSTIFSSLTSNDVVIMTMTPLVIYCCQFAKVRPFPYLLASFYGANLSGLIFVVSNPTNVIVAQALGITFVNYFTFMFLPTITCIVLGYISILIVSRYELGLNMEDLIPIPLVQYYLRKYSDHRLEKQNQLNEQQDAELLQYQHQRQINEDILEQRLSRANSGNSPTNNDTTLSPTSGSDLNNIGSIHSTLNSLQNSSGSSFHPSQFQIRHKSNLNDTLDDLDQSSITKSPSKLPHTPSFQFPGTKAVDPEEEIRQRGDIPQLPYASSKREKLERTLITLPQHNANDDFRDPRGAIYHASLLILCLLVMATSSFIYDGIQIWMVSCVCSLLSLVYDLIMYPFMPYGKTLCGKRPHNDDVIMKTTVSDVIEAPRRKDQNGGGKSTSLSSEEYETKSHEEIIQLNKAVIFDTKSNIVINQSASQSSFNPPPILPQSSISTPYTQSRPSSPLTPVDPFAVSLEAVDDVYQPNSSEAHESGYSNPFTLDEYEIIDVNNTKRGSSTTSRTVQVKTEFISTRKPRKPRKTPQNKTLIQKQVSSDDYYEDGAINNADNNDIGNNPDQNDDNDQTTTTTTSLDPTQLSLGTDRELCVYNILKALPWDAPIFVCAMFILVKSLLLTGWVDTIATGLLDMAGGVDVIAAAIQEPKIVATQTAGYIIDTVTNSTATRRPLTLLTSNYHANVLNNLSDSPTHKNVMGVLYDYVVGTTKDPAVGTIFRLSFLFGFIELLLCNLMNNQPATILITYVLLRCDVIIGNFQTTNGLLPIINPDEIDTVINQPGLHPYYKQIMLFSVIAASNYSAIVTLVASLAGIILSGIVKTKLEQRIDEIEAEIRMIEEGSNDETRKNDNFDPESISLSYKDRLINEQKELKTQFITYLQFSTRGLYVIPGVYLMATFALIASLFYAAT
jgi:Na+/H+ antiporter NhaD/arsenite permease-like protein